MSLPAESTVLPALRLLLDPTNIVTEGENGRRVSFTSSTKRVPSKKLYQSCEDIFSPSWRTTAEENTKRSSRFSLDLLGESRHQTSNHHHHGIIVEKARELWVELIKYSIRSLVPSCDEDHQQEEPHCAGAVGSCSSQCFFGYEIASVLKVYLEGVLPGADDSSTVSKTRLICSRLLASGVIRDARRTESLEFRESRLYRFSSRYFHSMKTSVISNDTNYHQERRVTISIGRFKFRRSTFQSLVRSWKRTRSTSEESTEIPPDHVNKPPLCRRHTLDTISQYDHLHPKTPLDKHANSFKERHYHAFNPKGYPAIKIPVHAPRNKKTKPPLPQPHSGNNSSRKAKRAKVKAINDTSKQQQQQLLRNCTSVSTLTSVTAETNIASTHSNSSNDSQWVVYGYI